jgi:NAD(P)-dependent dehydrogenase (short-subunit alcohol dehydrogenase family)
MAALTNSSKALSKPLGVHVDTVATGFIETEGANGPIEKTASESGSDLDNARPEIMNSIGGIPLERPGLPEEVASGHGEPRSDKTPRSRRATWGRGRISSGKLPARRASRQTKKPDG